MDEYVLPPNLSEELVGAEPEEDRLPSYDELSPAYDSQAHRQCMEHAFPLPGNCRSQPTLRLASSASSSRNVPLYTPGDSVITGTFDLDMHPGANFNVEGIDIKIIGQIIQPLTKLKTVDPFERGSNVFVDFSQPLWSKCSSILLEGKVSLPFTLQIPTYTLSGKLLPASTQERPKEDPDYWETLELVAIVGTLNNREVQVECQVGLPTYLGPHQQNLI
ncbi:hypothetical protein HWV62_610 [Athelia sp. TMB]|nr:hypothetical protein HWV62_610 [Athelia sp. TMB]